MPVDVFRRREKRALILTAVAHTYASAGLRAKAADALERALRDSETVPCDDRVPLRIMISRVYFSVEPQRAGILADAQIHAALQQRTNAQNGAAEPQFIHPI